MIEIVYSSVTVQSDGQKPTHVVEYLVMSYALSALLLPYPLRISLCHALYHPGQLISYASLLKFMNYRQQCFKHRNKNNPTAPKHQKQVDLVV